MSRELPVSRTGGASGQDHGIWEPMRVLQQTAILYVLFAFTFAYGLSRSSVDLIAKKACTVLCTAVL